MKHRRTKPALDMLAELNIPLIPVTSKTCAELFTLRAELNNHHPFATENGAAVYVPREYFPDLQQQSSDDIRVSTVNSNYYVVPLGHDRAYWRDVLAKTDDALQAAFTSFTALGTDGIVEHTGLSPERAAEANTRAATEPLLWTGDDEQLQQLRQHVEAAGGQLLRGGRFVHVLDARASKARALQWLADCYAQYTYSATFCAALGDAENDVSMLAAADYPIVIRSPHNVPPNTSHIDNIQLSAGYGPTGWEETVMAFIRYLLDSGKLSKPDTTLI